MERRVACALGVRRWLEATWTTALAGRSIDTTVPSMPLQTGTSIVRGTRRPACRFRHPPRRLACRSGGLEGGGERLRAAAARRTAADDAARSC
jgi:hypothetical protein